MRGWTERRDLELREALEPVGVLIADPEPAVRARLAGILREHGYAVIEAEGAAEALLQAGAHLPDVVLIDPALRDGAGASVARLLREMEPLRTSSLIALVEPPAGTWCVPRVFDHVLERTVPAPALLAVLERCLAEQDPRGRDAAHGWLTLETEVPTAFRVEAEALNVRVLQGLRQSLRAAGVEFREDESGEDRVLLFRASVAELLDLGVGRDAPEELLETVLHAYPGARGRRAQLEARLAELAAAHRLIRAYRRAG